MADFEVFFLDIGEGDSSLLKLPGEQWVLIDVFRCEGHGIDLFRVLDDKLPDGEDGKRRLDLLVITHAHDDHIRGLKDLVERYDVREIWAPQYNTELSLGKKFDEFKEVMDEHDNVEVKQGSRTPIAYLGEDEVVAVRCFSPPGYIDLEETLTEEKQRAEVHANCGVYKFSYAGISVMFAGDSDLACWDRVTSYYKEIGDEESDEPDLSVMDSTVLHASHHGSRTFFKTNKDDKPSLDALNNIDPEAVVVSVGGENRHEHPHTDAMKCYRDKVGEAGLHDTENQGTITLEVEADGNYDIRPDNGEFEEAYAWEDEDDDDDDGSNSGPSGGGRSAAGIAASRRKPRAKLDESSAA